MVMSSSDNGALSAIKFFWNRISRVVPPYYAATALKIILSLAVPTIALHCSYTRSYIISSFLFIPAISPDTGKIFPVITQGWTLSYEMMFYALFAISIAFSRRRILSLCLVLIGISIASMFRDSSWPVWSNTINPLVMEFSYGILIGQMVLSGRRLSPIIAVLLIPFCVFLLIFGENLIGSIVPNARFLWWGLPGAGLVISAIALEGRIAERYELPFAALGDASYSIYLFHTFILPIIALVWKKFHISSTTPAAVAAIGVAVLASILSGILIHRYFERPSYKILRRIFPG